MNRHLLTFVFLVVALLAKADTARLLERLDSTLARRDALIEEKELKIAHLGRLAAREQNPDMMLRILHDIYDEYHVYRFDSAMVYVNKGLQLAQRQGNTYYETLFMLNRSEQLALGGLYSEAIRSLADIDSAAIDAQLRFRYLFTHFTLYAYWSDYCNDDVYAPQYRATADAYLRRAISYVDPQDPLCDYYLGEYATYVDHDSQEARRHYQRLLDRVPESARAYAMSCFALAGNYLASGDEQRYAEYLIRASLSDAESSTMENLALQTLAVYLFQHDETQISRAQRYIQTSMNDALCYNNRLRIIEISQVLPTIVNAFQDKVTAQNRSLRFSVGFISLLLVGLLLAAYFVYRQNLKLTARRRELSAMNGRLSALNDQLSTLNDQLVETNRRREGLASIYIDLCAKYIDRLGKYQTLVKRKIRANQVQELLSTISSTRISEEDAQTFLGRFDKAFLELYPTFVDELGCLLRPECRVQLKSTGAMTTELRMLALMRLGVKNTTDIAGLLFHSPQTIYNARSAMRAKAIDKDTFDDDVLRLCSVIQT